MGFEVVEDRNSCIPRQFLLKGPCRNLHRLISSEPHHWGSSLKSIRDIRGGTAVSGIRARARGQLSLRVLAEAIVPLMSPPPHRDIR